MVLSRRERYAAIGTAIVVALFVLDRYALTPILDAWDKLDKQRVDLQAKVDDDQAVLKQKPAAEKAWKTRVSDGLKADSREAENALLHAVQAWSQDSRLPLTSVGAEHAARQGRATQDVTVQVSGVGPMSAVARFLSNAQKTRLPVKVVSMELYARKEGTDDLSLTLHLSGLYIPASGQVATPARTAPAAGGSRP